MEVRLALAQQLDHLLADLHALDGEAAVGHGDAKSQSDEAQADDAHGLVAIFRMDFRHGL